jgi:hypothetical protein
VQVGEIAAPATGNEDFFADALSALQHGHATAALAGFHGAHEPGCAPAENDDVKVLSHAEE